jgi:hypothetical protein
MDVLGTATHQFKRAAGLVAAFTAALAAPIIAQEKQPNIDPAAPAKANVSRSFTLAQNNIKAKPAPAEVRPAAAINPPVTIPLPADFEYLQFGASNIRPDFHILKDAHLLPFHRGAPIPGAGEDPARNPYYNHIIVVNYLRAGDKFSAYQQKLVYDTIQNLRAEGGHPIVLAEVTIDDPRKGTPDVMEKNGKLYSQYTAAYELSRTARGDPSGIHHMPFVAVSHRGWTVFDAAVNAHATSIEDVKANGRKLILGLAAAVRAANGRTVPAPGMSVNPN